jgi:hypothetical protein
MTIIQQLSASIEASLDQTEHAKLLVSRLHRILYKQGWLPDDERAVMSEAQLALRAWGMGEPMQAEWVDRAP